MNKIGGKRSITFTMMKALLLAYLITIIILLLLSFLVLKMDISVGVVRVGIILTYILSTFVGGIVMGKSMGQKKYLWGLGVGILYFLFILIVSIILKKSDFAGSGSIISVLGMCSLGGMLGGMLS